MRKTALFLALGASLGLMAQEGQKYGVVQGVFGTFNDASKLDNRLGGGLGAGLWVDNYVGLDLKGIYMPLKHENGTKSKEADALLSLMFNFRPGASNWYPYLAVGPGVTRAGGGLSGSGKLETALNFHAGVGLMGRVSDHWLLQGDIKAMRVDLPRSAYTPRNELLAMAGVGYTWGGIKAAPVVVAPPAPAPEPAPAPAPAPEPVVVKPAPAPEPVPTPEPVVVKPAPEPVKIVLDEATLHFKNGKADLSPEAVGAIQKVAVSLKGYPDDYKVVVAGYTSSVGSIKVNKSLSKRRADAVAKVLVDSGVNASAVSTEGYGPVKPIADNATLEGQAKNRRVEIEVKPAGAHAEIRKNEVGLQEATPAPKPVVTKKGKKVKKAAK